MDYEKIINALNVLEDNEEYIKESIEEIISYEYFKNTLFKNVDVKDYPGHYASYMMGLRMYVNTIKTIIDTNKMFDDLKNYMENQSESI